MDRRSENVKRVTTYVYLVFGERSKFHVEFCYSLATLLAHTRTDERRVILFTDNPGRYATFPVETISIKDEMQEMSLGGKYVLRLKPLVILKALAASAGLVLFLDSDTFVRKDLAGLVGLIGQSRIVMHRREKTDPYTSCRGARVRIDSDIIYEYSRDCVMYNSGVVGMLPCHATLLRQAVALIDGLLDLGHEYHTTEQFALSEVCRLSGIEIAAARPWITHYWRTTDRRYMHHCFQQRTSRQPLWPAFDTVMPFGYWRSRFYKISMKVREWLIPAAKKVWSCSSFARS